MADSFVRTHRSRTAWQRRRLAAASSLVVLAACTAAEPIEATGTETAQDHRVTVVTVASGLEHPWGVAFLPNGEILVTEREGRIRLVRDGALQQQPVSGGPDVWARGQGGLLDIALHPRFAENQLVYLTYSKAGQGGGTTALARARWTGSALEGLQDLIVTEAWSSRQQHFGSRIVFDSAGFVYFGVGDRNELDPAQDLSNHKGTVLRLHDDGRVPADNPFVNQSGARPEIFSYGHRNPQGMALNPSTGELWLNEHGPRGGDEINRVLPGRNYGWPRITHGVDYSGSQITPDTARAGMEQPLLHWTPSIAPSGMIFYQGDRFPGWRGNVFSGALAGEHLRRVVFDGTRPARQQSLLEGRARIRDVAEHDGFIYVLTDARNGALLRLEPAA